MKRLLSVPELGYQPSPAFYRALGYEVVTEYSVRKAIRSVRTFVPEILVADMVYQPDFRDRVSNLESLLAAVQSGAVYVVVLYDVRDEHALIRLQQRFQIDIALPLPISETTLAGCLSTFAVVSQNTDPA